MKTRRKQSETTMAMNIIVQTVSALVKIQESLPRWLNAKALTVLLLVIIAISNIHYLAKFTLAISNTLLFKSGKKSATFEDGENSVVLA